MTRSWPLEENTAASTKFNSGTTAPISRPKRKPGKTHEGAFKHESRGIEKEAKQGRTTSEHRLCGFSGLQRAPVIKRIGWKSLRKKLIARFGSFLAYWTIRILGWTMRLEEVHSEIPRTFYEKGISAIGVFWHGRLLMMPLIYKGKKLCFLVSPHRDGQVVGKALERFGYHAILGSSSRRGFAAFKQMLRANKEGADIALTPDGPRGPRYRVQIGVIELAKWTGRPIVPLTFGASRGKMLNTWDRFLLPYPFSRGVYIWGEPVQVDSKGDRAHLEEKRTLLEKRLNELTEQADRFFDSEKK